MGTNHHLLLHLVVGTLISSALICLVSAQYDLADQPFVLDNGLVYRDLFTIESSKAVGDFARAYDVQEKVEIFNNKINEAPTGGAKKDFLFHVSGPFAEFRWGPNEGGQLTSVPETFYFPLSRIVNVPENIRIERQLADQGEVEVLLDRAREDKIRLPAFISNLLEEGAAQGAPPADIGGPAQGLPRNLPLFHGPEPFSGPVPVKELPRSNHRPPPPRDSVHGYYDRFQAKPEAEVWWLTQRDGEMGVPGLTSDYSYSTILGVESYGPLSPINGYSLGRPPHHRRDVNSDGFSSSFSRDSTGSSTYGYSIDHV